MFVCVVVRGDRLLRVWTSRVCVVAAGPEYGTTAAAWKGVLTEADRMAEVHSRVKDRLIDTVEKEIAVWKKENFRKSALGPHKETKALEEDFKKVGQATEWAAPTQAQRLSVVHQNCF